MAVIVVRKKFAEIIIKKQKKLWQRKVVYPIGVQKGGSQYSPAIYTIDIAYNIDIPLYIFDRYITGI